MATPDEWIGTEEAARELGMSPDWIRARIRAGQLAAREWSVGGRKTYRIQRRDLQAFLREHARDLGNP
jgi:excisionase family DNA binding protein